MAGAARMIGTAFLCLAATAVDGDTLRCANIEDANGRVRLARIDAPEMREPGGSAAKEALAALIAGREVRCEHVDATPRAPGFQDRDRFGRVVARYSVGGEDLGERMIALGHARWWG